MLLNATARVSHFLIALNRNFKSFINTTYQLFFLIVTSWSQRTYQVAFDIYIIKAGVCGQSYVPTLTSPPFLKLLDSQGYLWLPYDLMEVIKVIGVTFKQKNTLCHSFRISVIPSVILSFLPDYCHSFRIIVIPSGLLSFLPNYCHSF